MTSSTTSQVGASGPLGAGEAALVRASAVVAAWSLGRVERDGVVLALRAASKEADPADVEEVLLQSYLFLGYPAALNALAVWREVSGLPAAERSAATEPDLWTRRGREVCRRVYGGQYGALRGNIRRLHPDMERWMVQEGYGKVLGRPGVDLRVRELCIVGTLAVTPWPTQLYSHLRGALGAGAEPVEVEAALELALDGASEGVRKAAMATWEQVLARVREGGSSGSGR